MKKTTKCIVSFFLLFLLIWIFYKMNNGLKKEHINFAVPALPYSSDPMEYDEYAHHHAFTSVFLNLVSTGKNGEIFPGLAYKWSNENNFKVWHFFIRKDLTYSNGDLITIEDIIKNFKRVLYFKKMEKSESGVLENLVDYEKLASLEDNITGIKWDNDKITFEFVKEMPTLLEKIAFGFYSLAHPSLYDHSTGKWKDDKKVIASGAYEVKKWTSEDFILQLRSSYGAKNSLQEIIFKEVKKLKSTEDVQSIDILMADQKTTIVNDNFVFNGSTTGLKIGYVECYSWNDKHSPFYDIAIRKWFRQKFYEGLNKENFSITHSFFPLALSGVNEINDNSVIEKPAFSYFTIKTSSIPKPINIKGQMKKKSLADIFQSAMNNLSQDSGAGIIYENYNFDEKFDLLINGTGIEASNYWDTVRFMFNSKQGIQLPDTNGKIANELNKKSPNIQKINELLWDQAVIWPIRHYTSGFWFNEKSNIDYSEMNFDSPAIDFQFLKWK